MADLIAVVYPDEAGAELAASDTRWLTPGLVIEPDAIAVIARDAGGRFHVQASHYRGATGSSWGMFWGLLFGLLFFMPSFGLSAGPGIGATVGGADQSGVDRAFQARVRDMVQPGTSALFAVVATGVPGMALDPARRYGGAVLRTPLSQGGGKEFREARRGQSPGAA